MLKKNGFIDNRKISFFPLGLGTASLAGINMVNSKHYTRPSNQKIEELINSSFELLKKNGSEILMIDTSSQYGESEKRIGNYINKYPKKLSKMFICTKWGLKFQNDDFSVQDYSLENLNTSLKKSIDNLKKIDLLYIHTNPAVGTKTLETIMSKDSEIIKRLNEIKKKGIGGINFIGISISTEKNLEFLISNKYLSGLFDVIQLNANILIKRPDLDRQLKILNKTVILNSLYRKSEEKQRSTFEGRRKIFFDSLSLINSAILLTGTSDLKHLNECFKIVEEFNTNKTFKLTCLVNEKKNNFIGKKVQNDLGKFLSNLNQTSNGNLDLHQNNKTINKETIIYIVNCFIGSLKTRIGSAPDREQFEILYDIIEHYVNKNIPIDTILTWGPKKFFSGQDEDFIDLSEVLSLKTLFDLNNKIREKYFPGANFTIFIEDFEGKFIEGESLDKIFNNYITSFEKLLKIIDLGNIIKIVRTEDLLKTNFDIKEINLKLNDNYQKLKKYWVESEKKGIEGSENYETYKAINKIGWYEKIGNDTRDYYLNRLDRMLGNTKTREQKVDMTVRLLSCVLIHRQFGVFEVNNFKDPVKLSFLKISGGPKKLMNGRIDIRTIPTNISKRHIAAWAAKGCVKLKNNNYLPVLNTWREVNENKSNFIKVKINIKTIFDQLSFETPVITN